MNFLTKILNSIYSPEFYATIPQKTLGSALRYFLLLAFALIIVRTVSFAPSLLFDAPKNIQSMVDSAIGTYPAELEVRIQNGQATTNVQEPYFIPLPSGQVGSPPTIVNLIVIDTKTPFSTTAFSNYKTIAWLTKDALFTRNSGSGEIKTIDLAQIPNYTINKDSLIGLEKNFSPWIKFIGPLALVAALLGLYILYTGRLLYLLILALIIWIISKIFRKAFTYGQSYKIGLYAMTLALLIDLATSFLPWKGFPFMFTIITLGVVTVNIFLKKSAKSS